MLSTRGDSTTEARVETTDLLQRWQGGDRDAADSVLRRCYDELRSLARHRLRGERAEHTLDATELVHEIFLRQLEDCRPAHDRAHFVGRAGQAMRALLVDHARRRHAGKRGGDGSRVPLDEARHAPGAGPGTPAHVDLLDLERALQELEALDPSKARLVELRYFLGLDIAEAAQALGMSRASAGRRWRLVRAWLQQRLGAGIEM